MKRILEIGVYGPGDLRSEVTGLTDVNENACGNRMVFTGHATVKSHFKGQEFSSLYRLTKVYQEQQGDWRVVASSTARLGDK